MKQLPIAQIQDADLKDKIVLIRVDHNVVKNGKIHDPYRIDATLGTLYYINAKGGKPIIMTHIGRPKNKQTGEIEIAPNTSVKPVVDYLKNKLHITIKTPDFKEHKPNGYLGIETSINHLIKELKNNIIDAIYLPNTRWFSGEEGTPEASDSFAYQLAGLADIYINDAFGSWQPHASTIGINQYLPSYAGFLLQKEIYNLNRIFMPQKPFLAVVAGSKFDTKIEPLFALLKKADYLILGGVIFNAYLCAKYGFTMNGITKSNIDTAKKFVKEAEKYPNKIIELKHIIESDTIPDKTKDKYRTHNIDNLPKGKNLNYVLDIDKKSFEEKHVKETFEKANTIFVNAVMGLTPHFSEGTIALDQLIDKNKNATKLYGGGDTMQELKRLLPGLYIMALDQPDYYIFTGGGAVLKAIQHGKTSGLEPISKLLKKNVL